MYQNFGVGIPNPSSVYCGEHGGISEIRSDKLGNQYGVCKFSDGTECEEWDYQGGKCQPGQCKNIINDPVTDKPTCQQISTKNDKSLYVVDVIIGTFLVILAVGLISSK